MFYLNMVSASLLTTMCISPGMVERTTTPKVVNTRNIPKGNIWVKDIPPGKLSSQYVQRS